MFDNLVSGVLLKKENYKNWLIKEMVHLQKNPTKNLLFLWGIYDRNETFHIPSRFGSNISPMISQKTEMLQFKMTTTMRMDSNYLPPRKKSHLPECKIFQS
jgi:hypothetical protein